MEVKFTFVSTKSLHNAIDKMPTGYVVSYILDDGWYGKSIRIFGKECHEKAFNRLMSLWS